MCPVCSKPRLIAVLFCDRFWPRCPNCNCSELSVHSAALCQRYDFVAVRRYLLTPPRCHETSMQIKFQTVSMFHPFVTKTSQPAVQRFPLLSHSAEPSAPVSCRERKGCVQAVFSKHKHDSFHTLQSTMAIRASLCHLLKCNCQIFEQMSRLQLTAFDIYIYTVYNIFKFI